MLKYLLLALMGFSCSVKADALYQLSATLLEDGKEISFPAVELSDNGEQAASEMSGCSYQGAINRYLNDTIIVMASLTCSAQSHRESVESMPVFILPAEGETASYEFEDDDEIVWKYSVTVKKLD